MTNLEWLNENLTKEEKSNVQMCVVVNKKFYKYTCDGKNCYDCPLNKVGDLIDLLLQEHKEPVKLKKWEKDLITLYTRQDDGWLSREFHEQPILRNMKNKGNFQGITDESMTLQEILDNCKIEQEKGEEK